MAAFYTAEYLFDIRASNRDMTGEAAGAVAPSDRAVFLDGLHNKEAYEHSVTAPDDVQAGSCAS